MLLKLTLSSGYRYRKNIYHNRLHLTFIGGYSSCEFQPQECRRRQAQGSDATICWPAWHGIQYHSHLRSAHFPIRISCPNQPWCDDLLTSMAPNPVSFSSQVSTFNYSKQLPRPTHMNYSHLLINFSGMVPGTIFLYPLSQLNFFLCPIFLQLLGHLRTVSLKLNFVSSIYFG